MCQFAAYEFTKSCLVSDTDAYDPVANLMAGGCAGGCAASFTTPLDVVKTRLQTQGATQHKYSGAIDAIRSIAEAEGVVAFTRGMGPRVLFHVPSMAICWTTYESSKYFLKVMMPS